MHGLSRRRSDGCASGVPAPSASARSLSAALRLKFHAAFVVDADAFHPDHLADFRDVFRSFDAEIRQLGNVHEAVFAREDFDEGAEFFDRNNFAVIGLADFDLARHAADDFLRARHRFGIVRVDVYGTVVFDVNLRAGFSDDAFDRLAAGSDEGADFLRINF